MDPVSQGLVGAVLPQSHSNKREIRKATIIGLVSGMMADLDVLIRSTTEPLIFIDYHRQFTHSIIFIPIGRFISALIFWLLFKKSWFKKIQSIFNNLKNLSLNYKTALWKIKGTVVKFTTKVGHPVQ